MSGGGRLLSLGWVRSSVTESGRGKKRGKEMIISDRLAEMCLFSISDQIFYSNTWWSDKVDT